MTAGPRSHLTKVTRCATCKNPAGLVGALDEKRFRHCTGDPKWNKLLDKAHDVIPYIERN